MQEKEKEKKMGGVKDIKSKQELDNLVKDGSAVMVHFWASWCDASKHMDQVFSHLSTDFPNAHFLRVCFFYNFFFVIKFRLFYIWVCFYLLIKFVISSVSFVFYDFFNFFCYKD